MSSKRDAVIPVGVGFITMAVYVSTLHPSLPGGDSGELILAAHELGVAHPPGYPVFTLLAHVAMVIIPFGSIAWRVNLLCATFGALCATVIYQTSAKLTGSVAAGMLASGLFAFSRLTWAWSTTAEVFSLNNLFVSLLMLLAVWLEQTASASASSQIALLGSFVCGLSLCNQHTSVIYIACLVPWVFNRLHKSQMLTWPLFVKLCVCFAAGLTPYLYLPLSAHANVARWTWGDQRTLQGFITHLLREEYGTFQLIKDHTGHALVENLRKYSDYVLAEYSISVLPLVVFLVPSVCKRVLTGQQRVVGAFLTMFLVYVVFFAWRANWDTANPLLLGVVERFWMQSDVVFVIVLALAFSHVVRLVSAYVPINNLKLDVVISVAVIAFQMQKNYSSCDQSGNYVIDDFAKSVLRSLPNDSILLTEGDLSAVTLKYFHLCENIRPDLAIFDQQILTYEWSLAMTRKFHSKIVFPGDIFHLHSGKMADGKISFNFKHLLDVNYKKPIFTCIGVQVQDPSWKNYYDLWPYGTCHQFVKKDSNFDVAEWVQHTKLLGNDWKYDFYGYPQTSWEKVATEQMWHSKIATAFHFLEVAFTMESEKEAVILMTTAYELYMSALTPYGGTPTRVPPHWHRNFGIVCDWLSGRQPRLDSRQLSERAVRHFQLYVDAEGRGADTDGIRRIIDRHRQKIESHSPRGAASRSP